jgi:homoserine kinase
VRRPRAHYYEDQFCWSPARPVKEGSLGH